MLYLILFNKINKLFFLLGAMVAMGMCNNLGVFFTFWAFFNFELKGINFQNCTLKVKIDRCPKIEMLLHAREMG